MRKLVFSDSFDYPEAEHLVKIVDDPQDRRKIASTVTDSWGEIEPIKNHTLVHLIALGSGEKTGSNLNADYFPEDTCRSTHDSFVKKASLYRHHNSKVPKEQRDGDVVRSAYNEKMGRVELIIAANHDKCADWLGKLEKGGEAKFSMGWHCPVDECSICGNKATKPNEYCEHISKKAKAPYGRNRILEDGRKCYMINKEGHWNDISYVDRGADMIAMDLAKIAGIDPSEVLGGADLAELLEHRVLSTGKLAIAHKLSEMQKRIDAIGVKAVNGVDKTDLSESAIRELQAKSPKEMFGSLAKCGAILSFNTFFKLASGSRFQDFESIIKQSEPVLRECIRKELKEASSLEAISSIHEFDPSSVSSPLTQRTISELTQFSIEPTWQEEKIKMAALMTPTHTQGSTEVTKQAQALVRQYLAYKVALLDNVSANDEMIFNALMLN